VLYRDIGVVVTAALVYGARLIAFYAHHPETADAQITARGGAELARRRANHLRGAIETGRIGIQILVRGVQVDRSHCSPP
jgi:hypothetical protein